MPLVVFPDNLGYPATLPEGLTSGPDEVCHYNDLPDVDEFIRRSRDADALVWAWTRLTPALLDECGNLKVATFMGVGASDYIDLPYAASRGIVVCNTPHYGDDAVAELTFALLLALVRKVREADRSVREGLWDQAELEGSGLLGKTMGVIGLGGSGAKVAALAGAFGMRVLSTTAHPSPERARKHDVAFVPLETLLQQSDCISLHVTLSDQTRCLIGERELGLMKPSAVLINMARAEVVDTDALCDALRGNRIGGAATDVWEKEPPPADHPLIGLENALLSPHLGWNTDTAKWRMLDIALENVRGFFAGRPQNVVAGP